MSKLEGSLKDAVVGWASQLVEAWASRGFAESFAAEGAFEGDDGTAAVDLSLAEKIDLVDEMASDGIGGGYDELSRLAKSSDLGEAIATLSSRMVLLKAEGYFREEAQAAIDLSRELAALPGTRSVRLVIGDGGLGHMPATKHYEQETGSGKRIPATQYRGVEGGSVNCKLYETRVCGVMVGVIADF